MPAVPRYEVLQDADPRERPSSVEHPHRFSFSLVCSSSHFLASSSSFCLLYIDVVLLSFFDLVVQSGLSLYYEVDDGEELITVP